ncbi:MAG: FAD binding domain-containing protein [Pseudomonadota bacterium]|nr:FAD binding domain-containing protein [Pseudomonadota bacterium]
MNFNATESGWVARSHKAILPFRLLQPQTAKEAAAALAENAGSTVIAGGIDLVRRMRSGQVWKTVIDLSSVDSMKGICAEDDFIRIGALTTHWEIETNPLLQKLLPAFQEAWKTIGNIRVRMTGTIGGNVMADDPGYDGQTLLGVLCATLEFVTKDGKKKSVLASKTGWQPPRPAVLASILIPVGQGVMLAFDRSLKPAVSAAVALEGDTVRVGVGCAFDTPAFWMGSPKEPIDAIIHGFPNAKNNPMGQAAYRRRMAGVLVRRALLKFRSEN